MPIHIHSHFPTLLLFSPFSSLSMLKAPVLSSSFPRSAIAALFLIAVALSCFILYRAVDSRMTHDFRFSDHVTSFYSEGEESSLERILKDASMDDKTVILTTLNEAWAAPNSIFDLFLESFRIGERTRWLLNHLVVVCLDRKAFYSCLSVHSNCFFLGSGGVDMSGEAYFMTPDYLKMMWRRIDFLRSVLQMGYNFVFTDADIMWFRDPFPHFDEDADFQIACDHFSGISDDIRNRPNGGFNYVRSNTRSIDFYKFWYSARETYPGLHDQDVLNHIKNNSFITDIGLKMRFLDTAYFGGFCEPSKDLNLVCTMHANCCFGLNNKLHDLRILLEDWKEFLSLPPTLKASIPQWRVPQKCGLKSLHHDSHQPSPSRTDGF